MSIEVDMAAMHIRCAGIDDIDVLVNQHDAMFREIYAISGRPIDDAAFAAMGEAYRKKLVKQMTDGACCAWVIENDTAIVASAAITRYEAIPIPTDSNSEIAYLHSVYTESAYRKKGYAKHLVRQAMQYCVERGINRIDLAASAAGRSIYEGLGFEASPAAMRFSRPVLPFQPSSRPSDTV